MQNQSRTLRRGLTVIEVLIIVAIISVCFVLSLPMLRRSFAAERMASCANNMKQLGLSMKMYAQEHNGMFPPIAWHDGPPYDCSAVPISSMTSAPSVQRFAYTMDFSEMYADYLSDAALLICPADTDFNYANLKNPVSGQIDVWHPCAAACRGWALADNSYTYFGYIFEEVGNRSLTADELLALHPFPTNRKLNYMADVIATWDADHPEFRVSSLLPGATPIQSVPISMQLFAWQQVIGDTIYRGAPGAATAALKDGVAVGPPSRVLQIEGRKFAADINDSTTNVAPNTVFADLDWSSAADLFPLLNPPNSAGKYLGSGDTHTIFRISENVGRFLITDLICYSGSSPSQDPKVPVLFDSPALDPSNSAHRDGTNVLYIDGHVEFVPFTPAATSEFGDFATDEAIWTTRLLHYFLEKRAQQKTGLPALDVQCP